jgi:hypothetical protein
LNDEEMEFEMKDIENTLFLNPAYYDIQMTLIREKGEEKYDKECKQKMRLY